MLTTWSLASYRNRPGATGRIRQSAEDRGGHFERGGLQWYTDSRKSISIHEPGMLSRREPLSNFRVEMPRLLRCARCLDTRLSPNNARSPADFLLEHCVGASRECGVGGYERGRGGGGMDGVARLSRRGVGKTHIAEGNRETSNERASKKVRARVGVIRG